LCAKVPPGVGRIQGCLKAHESELSDACRSRVDELGREAGVLAASCRWGHRQVLLRRVAGGWPRTCLPAGQTGLADSRVQGCPERGG